MRAGKTAAEVKLRHAALNFPAKESTRATITRWPGIGSGLKGKNVAF
jgi:hypothetical protein